mmetsp:Transcript_18081/g.53524  ORF Transcript_18081/g.53524 Transcript_18081/m.53524 type:complete len:241 (+) Transcript_18081:376-1098(+)
MPLREHSPSTKNWQSKCPSVPKAKLRASAVLTRPRSRSQPSNSRSTASSGGAASTCSCVIPVSLRQNGVRVWLAVGRTKEWNSCSTCSVRRLSATTGNSMISCSHGRPRASQVASTSSTSSHSNGSACASARGLASRSTAPSWRARSLASPRLRRALRFASGAARDSRTSSPRATRCGAPCDTAAHGTPALTRTACGGCSRSATKPRLRAVRASHMGADLAGRRDSVVVRRPCPPPPSLV